MATETRTTVAIVGAGPVGLFTALLLAQAGIKVIVFETGTSLNRSPRAVAYFPAVLDEFKKAGILQEVIDKGEKNTDGCAWRDPSGRVLAAVDPPPDSPHFAVCLSQPEFCEIVYKRLLETGNAEVIFNHTYRRHEQKGSSILLWIKSSPQESEIIYECEYLIGTDGGRSDVRKALGLELKGFTWASLQLVAVNFQYSLSEPGWKKANFIVDEVCWGVIVKRGKGNNWRFATGAQAPDAGNGALDDATIKMVKDRLIRLLPGDTSQIEWEAMAPYKIHQRCATNFRKGNVLLAGDAAHLNNPIGGLGLTTGLLDAAHLAESLCQTLLEKAEPIVLDQYAEIRRSIFLHRTNPLSTDNLNRLRSRDPEHVWQRDEFFAKLNKSKDIATILQVGLPDYGLSSTSKTSFSTYEEVTWFVTVAKIDGWSDEKFAHEYKVVHANMTRQGKEKGAPTRRYTQYKNLYQQVPGTKQFVCAYVTCLVFPNLFLVHAGLQDPGYRATAGAHIFCRLDQQGCLARKISEFSKELHGPGKSCIRALLFHERCLETDECSENWLQERAAKFSTMVKSDDRAYGYILWQDMTPKNSQTLFRDSQFEAGRWNNFKAVEAFDFLDTATANTFLGQQINHITENGKQTITAVVSDPDVIF
ncbi:3-3-hydroxy-phenylpropionate 3-hydroxycinnamic acid hydroxylase [Fusarium sporotrichioides]|uniref:3-3-hydroxy-phenylpropionate 3-hydroxycinnamic acid hydroxylase n=1 Tax=Fusarium sporotrichioides TaxID=5514 RepID=A0A395RWH2_FUSSP|nr:3-3-hydroxy-phenylpropionate 3-hydroxycinnamic acid hydroxylase [Fusarium sporotrichioides]